LSGGRSCVLPLLLSLLLPPKWAVDDDDNRQLIFGLLIKLLDCCGGVAVLMCDDCGVTLRDLENENHFLLFIQLFIISLFFIILFFVVFFFVNE
jgi:hypothetical protein